MAPTPPPARPSPGYEARIDSLDAVDTAVLAGRRIVLDPGHGGFFAGSIGVNGLTEAAVNLDVALHLKSLLEARGAEVFLTRDTERDFLTPADSALRADLTERTRIANEFQPELFVSIHHNADAGGAHDRNEIQTYYKLGDEGRSLDAAVSLHRYMKRNLGITRHRILPGNYFVLRNSPAAAVLTEASYLTNPDVEAMLARTEKRRLEAEALFLGIAHFFGRRVPVIENLVASDPPGARNPASATWRGPTLVARIRGAFDRAELTLNGQTVRVRREGDQLLWSPSLPLAAGPHRARLVVALSGQGAAAEGVVDFAVRRPLRRLWADAYPETLPSWGGIVAIRARVVDAYGLPVLDPVVVRLTAAERASPRDTVLTARGGVAWAYFRVRPARRGENHLRFGVRVVPAGAKPTEGAREAASATIATRPGARVATVFLRAATGDSAVRPIGDSASVQACVPSGGSWVTPHGFAAFALDSIGRARVPSLPGWRPLAVSDSAPPPAIPGRWASIAGGALHGRRIVLDPDGGGVDTAGMGPSGTRAAIYNMDVARALEGYLVAAGATVRLTRVGDIDASEVERVRASEAFGAERYLRIAHRPQAPRIGYYFSSPAGRAWAQRTAAELERLGLRAPPLVEDAQYPLQQTSCPAIYVSLARVDQPSDEDRMNAPGAVRAEAYALFQALAREWAPDAAWPVDSLFVRDLEGRPVPGAPVTVGAALVVETDAEGRVRFARNEPGPLAVDIDDPRVRSRAVLLDSARGIILTGPRGRASAGP